MTKGNAKSLDKWDAENPGTQTPETPKDLWQSIKINDYGLSVKFSTIKFD